jgi:hypothetical protein
MNEKLKVWVLVAEHRSKMATHFQHLQYNKYLSLSGELVIAPGAPGNWIFKQIRSSQRNCNNLNNFRNKKKKNIQ